MRKTLLFLLVFFCGLTPVEGGYRTNTQRWTGNGGQLKSFPTVETAGLRTPPYDNYVKLMLHFNADYDDASISDHTVTDSGATINTSIKKFGAGSSLFGNTHVRFISIPDSDDWNFGNGDFTIDFWYYPIDVGVPNGIDTEDRVYFFCQGITSGSNEFELMKRDAANNGVLEFWVGVPGTTYAYYVSAALAWTAETWYHIELVRSGTNIYIFRNGVSLSLTEIVAIGTNTLPDWDTPFNISGNEEHEYCTGGHFDEFRVSKGIAWHTSTFEPESSEYDP
jgi:hypothetical protein